VNAKCGRRSGSCDWRPLTEPAARSRNLFRRAVGLRPSSARSVAAPNRGRVDASRRDSERWCLPGAIRRVSQFASEDRKGEPIFVGTAPQSIATQLEHRATRESVERAKKQSRVLAVLARAEARDLEGKRKECFDAFAKARLMLDPFGGIDRARAIEPARLVGPRSATFNCPGPSRMRSGKRWSKARASEG